jgi:predicted nuclease of predicted toxin-antitoxin system
LDQFKLLTDENVHPYVAQWLRDRGFDVLDAVAAGLFGTTDVQVLRRAFSENRVVVTHDRDFGTLAVLAGEPLLGIVYLRPGHIDPQFTIESVDAALREGPEVSPPFILVVERRDDRVRMRIRQL